MRMVLWALAAVLIATTAAPAEAQRRDRAPAEKSAPAQSEPAAAAPTARPAITTAQDEALVRRLVVQSLLALHQANETADYTVFYKLASPAFRSRNTPAGLAESFRPLREAQLDLGVAAVAPAALAPAPTLGADQTMRVQGAIPGAGAPIAFAMVFVPVDGVWRLQEIALREAPSPPN